MNGERNLGPVRVLIVDDHAGFRTSMAQALDGIPEVVVAGEADSGEAACRSVVDLRPDIVVIDFAMPGMNSIDATRRIRRSSPGTRVVMLTGSSGERLEETAIAAGASVVVPKGARLEDVIGVILDTAGSPSGNGDRNGFR